MTKSADWNILIQQYTATQEIHPLDRRPDLWVCGYIPEAEFLRLHLTSGKRVLDYGCGNGRISRFLHLKYGFEVTGVDINSQAIARARSFNDGIAYSQIEPNILPANLSQLDACICNHVFPIYSSLPQICDTLKVIWKALKPGAPLVIYVDNTNYTGIHYHSFMGGSPSVRYESGDALPMRIYLNGVTVMEFNDVFWKPADYLQVIDAAGFTDVTAKYQGPEAAAMAIYEEYFGIKPDATFEIEKEYPPAALYCGVRPR